jgi:valyl-tRNA synthetase
MAKEKQKFSLAKTYDFSSVEDRLYKWWEAQGYFQPRNGPTSEDFDANVKPFVISIPPPNVTGELHLGHALFVAMEDLMIRHQRMRGVPTLWVPGSDHAGIATQLKVEESILQTEEVTREELGREEFLKRTWAWKEKYGSLITNQIRRLGASCDWSRERFTLDEGLSVAVREAFVRLYEKGLIYRGPRLINWSPGLRTAVSDLEVEYSEEEGLLYYFKYPIKDSDEYIPVATTRPETILADTAVAVHPEDERFKKFVGQTALVPILNREIPIIADDYVDREFGTGALKITPGHDINDYEIGQRHKLKILSVLDKEAQINEVGGPYKGMDRFDARKKIWADMKAAQLTIKTEAHQQRVPRSQRGGEIIEPMISTQWFVDIKPLADPALAAVEEGRIKIVPEHFTKVYRNWMENIQDWCISRQLWWGHRIPVWYAPDGSMFCARTEAEALAQAKEELGADVVLEQDPDVLDTWFSSGLWPFSTLGWPEETADFNYFYPTATLETGYDILFFWVARMIMLGIEFTGKEPFDTIYLHGIIRDVQGRKMSKTLGNVIDPLEIMDQFGTDALRYTLLVGSTPGQDVNVDPEKVEANRNFINKLWNVGRFVLNAIENAPDTPSENTDWTIADGWIWARMKRLIKDVDRLFAGDQYGEAGRHIYEFFWSDFADWYVEVAKLQLESGGDSAFQTANALVQVYEVCLKLLHPFAPFVTEELWGHLKEAAKSKDILPINGDWGEALIVAPWPEQIDDEGWEKERLKTFAYLQDAIRAIRNVRSEKQVKPSTLLTAQLFSEQLHDELTSNKVMIADLAKLEISKLEISSSGQGAEGSVGLVAGPIEIFLPMSEMVDNEAELKRLSNEQKQVVNQIERLEKLLASDFAKKAPEAVVAKERERLTEFQQVASNIANQLSVLSDGGQK